ncbi:hypothetical protein BDV93DRAFT_521461 [Ceratobasidium sp. AG-I]|nr:hypothetical protein BDV93DRAFT_521461 [Ceratobasidium sp. AG-I]
MSIDPETPRSQYAKYGYMIRIVGRIPRHLEPPSGAEDEPSPQGFRTRGMVLCAIDVTMSHVAAMYAAGRLLDTIREPFNASVIRAEMDALRDRNEAKVLDDDFERWKGEMGDKFHPNPLVGNKSHNARRARKAIPRCPYLFQLAYKSLYVGNQPAYWAGAREHSAEMFGTDEGHRNVKGRSGFDTFGNYKNEFWYLYIDVSLPLHPRYVFIQASDLYNCTNVDSKSLRLFNAQDHAVRYMIPDMEEDTRGQEFGEDPLERHTAGRFPNGRRKSNTGRLLSDPEYAAFIDSRKARAREHPAVVRMKQFEWLREGDAIKPDGTALLQQVWLYYGTDDDDIISTLVHRPESVNVVRSDPSDELEPAHPVYWEYPHLEILNKMQKLPSLRAIAANVVPGPSSIWSPRQGGVLSQLAELDGSRELVILKTLLTRHIWYESAKGGSGVFDSVSSWLDGGSPPINGSEEHELEIDYDMAGTRPKSGNWKWPLMYQALCYRDAVSREQRQRIATTHTSPTTAEDGPPLLNFEAILDSAVLSHEVAPFSYGSAPGVALGDVAHPAFDVSQFPQLSESEIICALKMWSDHVWMPALGDENWDYESRTPVSIRTLNVSGCHFVTRDTIRRALKAVPTITRIIMVGCVNFDAADFVALSLDGTFNTVDCVLTSESLRAPFEDPLQKVQARDDVYARAQSLLPLPPNDDVRDAVISVPGTLLGMGLGLKFEYHAKIQQAYFSNGLHTRQPSHTFARPPALGFHPETHELVHGPPRFTILLASQMMTGAPVTGASLPRVPIDTGIDGRGTNGSGLTSVWRGLIDLVEFLGCNNMRNAQRTNASNWSLPVKSCFSGSGATWEKKSGLAGGGEFYGFPAYFSGGPGRSNDEWMFVYRYQDLRSRVSNSLMNPAVVLLPSEEQVRDSWGFIRCGRDASPLSHQVPTMVIYDVRGFREAVCPELPIFPDEERWISRLDDLLTNGTWKAENIIFNGSIDRSMREKQDGELEKYQDLMARLSRPRCMKESPHDMIVVMEQLFQNDMNWGGDIF